MWENSSTANSPCPGLDQLNIGETLETLDFKPPTRARSATAITDDGYIFIFGGFDHDDMLDDNVYLLNLNTLKWSVKSSGLYREGHTATYIGGNKILIYGGVSDDQPDQGGNNNTRSTIKVNNFISDSNMLIYDYITNRWTRPLETRIFHSAGPRSRHACCVSHDKRMLFISGGFKKTKTIIDNSNYNNNNDNDLGNDLYCFNLQTGEWDGPRNYISRFDHTMIYNEINNNPSNSKLLSFSGLSDEMNHVKKVSMFDLSLNCLTDIKFSNTPRTVGTENQFFFNYKNSFILDIKLPTTRKSFNMETVWSVRERNLVPLISVFEVATLKYYPVLSSNFEVLAGYSWVHAFVVKDYLILLGNKDEREDDISLEDGLKLTHMIKFNLHELGIVPDNPFGVSQISNLPQQNIDAKSASSSIFTIDDSVLKEFNGLLQNQEFCDFNIVPVEGNIRPNEVDQDPIFIDKKDQAKFAKSDDDQPIFIKSDPISVHKLLLIARWPYFKRMIDAGMSESETNQVFIPEPYNLVKLLVEFFYTNEVSPTCTIDELNGLLHLSNLYYIGYLKNLVISKIYSIGFKVGTVLSTWKVSIEIDNPTLRHNCESFIRSNWGMLVKTNQFKELNKDFLIKLFETLHENSLIINESPKTSSTMTSNSNISTTSSLVDDRTESNLPSRRPFESINSVPSNTIFDRPGASAITPSSSGPSLFSSTSTARNTTPISDNYNSYYRFGRDNSTTGTTNATTGTQGDMIHRHSILFPREPINGSDDSLRFPLRRFDRAPEPNQNRRLYFDRPPVDRLATESSTIDTRNNPVTGVFGSYATNSNISSTQPSTHTRRIARLTRSAFPNNTERAGHFSVDPPTGENVDDTDDEAVNIATSLFEQEAAARSQSILNALGDIDSDVEIQF
ncbi:hypothetical protein B5S30_g2903 [[Candida] boidinii]|nr:hypothetical protein B5S30_g2903 [[Candida] boidinii]